jgi:hypothetical protein
MSQQAVSSSTTTKITLPSTSLLLPDLTSYSQPLSGSPAANAPVVAQVDSDEPTLEISPAVERSPERPQRGAKRSTRGATAPTRSAPKRAAAAISKRVVEDDDDAAYDDPDVESPKKTRKRAPAKKRGAAAATPSAAAASGADGSPRRGRPTRLEQDEDPNRPRVPHELSTGTLQAPPVADTRAAERELQAQATRVDARQRQLLAWAGNARAATDAQLAAAVAACQSELRDVRRVCCAAELSMPLMALFLRLEQTLMNQPLMLDVLQGETKHALLFTKQPHMRVPFKGKPDQVGTIEVELFSVPREPSARHQVEGLCESTAKDWSETHVKNASKLLDGHGGARFDALLFEESTRMEFVTVQFRAKLPSRAYAETCASNPMVVVTNESQWPGAARKLLWQHTFGDVDEIPWPLFGNYLNLLVVVSLYGGIETMVRALTPWELRFLHHRWFKSARVIEREAAIAFWSYFGPVLTALRFKRHIANMWEKGEMLGFMTKDETVALLREQDTGTFCLRFSESVPGAFAVAYMTNDEADPIKHFLVKPTDLGHNRTLPDFLRDKGEFRIMLTLASPDDPRVTMVAPKDDVLKKYYKVTKGAAAQQLRAADGYVNV